MEAFKTNDIVHVDGSFGGWFNGRIVNMYAGDGIARIEVTETSNAKRWPIGTKIDVGTVKLTRVEAQQ